MKYKTTYHSTSVEGQHIGLWSEYMTLAKHKLSLTVVVTSLLGYLIVSGMNFTFIDLMLLAVGGFLVAGAANGINQALEKDFDALMRRTADRPVAAGRMTVSSAVFASGIACLVGITLLSLFNPVTGVLGMVSFILYSFIYTPLKRVGTIAVAVGAVPGALPILIGCTAFEGSISWTAISLFAVQFLWQFPHFWSIGFLGFEDYKKAGFKLVPEKMGAVDERLGLNALLYASLILPVIAFMFYSGSIGLISFVLTTILAGIYMYFSYAFKQKFDDGSAKALMFCSFLFMPLFLIFCLIF